MFTILYNFLPGDTVFVVDYDKMCVDEGVVTQFESDVYILDTNTVERKLYFVLFGDDEGSTEVDDYRVFATKNDALIALGQYNPDIPPTTPSASGEYITLALNEYLGSTVWQGEASEILSQILTVDGSGSGLDANYLEGHDSMYFAIASDTYTKNEIDTMQSALILGLDWKEAVATFADLAITYPTPDEGWTVSVNDEDAIYRYNGASWEIIANGTSTSVFLDNEFAIEDNNSGFQQTFLTNILTANRIITLPNFDLNLNYINPEFLTNGLLFGINSGGGYGGGDNSIIIGNGSANTKLNNDNIIIGHNAGAMSNIGNVILGNYAGLSADADEGSGRYNVFAGTGAGNTLLKSENSIFIGIGAGSGTQYAYDSVMIGTNKGNAPRYLRYTTWIGADAGIFGGVEDSLGEDIYRNVILTDGMGRLSYRDDNTLGTTTIYNDLIARTPTFQDSTDNTKELHWDLSSISTLSNRTITAPDFDLNLNYINPEFLTNGLLFGINSGGGYGGGDNSIIIGNGSANSLLYNDNIIIGHNAGAMSNIGNVILGNYAGLSDYEETGGGSYNVFAGDHAGSTLLESENSIFIGDYVGYGVEYSYRSIMIGSNNEADAPRYLRYTTWIGADAGIFAEEGLIENVILTDGMGRLSYRDDNNFGTTTIYNDLIARNPTFQNSKDNTKELSWDLSSISTLSSRTITAPDFDFDFNNYFDANGSVIAQKLILHDLTTAQRDALNMEGITNAVIFNTTLGINQKYNGTGWVNLSPEIGYIDYNDLTTQTTPISIIGGAGYVNITNDGAGAYSSSMPPSGVTNVWNTVGGTFDWSELSIGDLIDIRLDLLLTTSNNNTEVQIVLELGTGANTYEIPFFIFNYKNTVTDQPINVMNGIYLKDTNTLNNGGRFKIKSDLNSSIKVNGWYCKIIKK